MSTVQVLRRVGRVACLIVVAGALGACGKSAPGSPGDPPGGDPAGAFESDLPGGGDSFGGTDASAERGAAGAAPPAASLPSSGPNNAAQDGDSAGTDASRIITEADVIQIAGDRLYALSRIAGLNVIDVSKPNQLRLLGSYRELTGNPFEMYLRGDVAILMFSGWGEYVETDDAYTYVQTSKIVALDVSDPAAIETVGDFDVPGSIQDSRIVGDVLYVVGLQDGYCWGCEAQKPGTTISSLDVSDPSAMRKVDELRYVDPTDQGYSWQRSITVTDQRMYVAGPEYGRNGPVGSTIQVVDISDPGGELVEGAVLQARGEISSRWQMDEYEGVLRVVSQSARWSAQTEPPRVQTFRVVSSQEFERLGHVDLVIPERETLRSARFDGPRGYVITAEQMDPLFTIDLSDPANPRQVGELEMPGFVYHMEPRGERVLGLGYDQGNPEGSITVSLFDVSDLAKPTMLSRVNFGGNWGSLPEDQDRIHKVFRILTEQNLLLVPFMGYERTDEWCGGKAIGGVQLIDYVAADDSMALRGAATTEGQARRALLHRDHLFAVSDERIEAFDIADRSEPTEVGQLIVSSPVSGAKQLDGGVVARVTRSYYDGRTNIELVDAAAAGDPNQRLSEVDLGSLLDADGESPCEASWYIQSLHADGSVLYVYYERYNSRRNADGEQVRGVLAVDASDPRNPQLLPGVTWSGREWHQYYDYYRYGPFVAGGGAPLWHGRVLALLEQRYDYRQNPNGEPRSWVRLRTVDLSDPADLKTATLELDADRRYSALLAEGDTLFTSHYQVNTSAASSRARFYVDRFDLSEPTAPEALAPINVPGALVHFDADSNRALTSQLVRVAAGRTTPQQCYERFAQAEFRYDDGVWNVDDNTLGDCVGFRQSLHLVELTEDIAVLEDTLTLEDDENVASWSAGDGVLFVSLGRGGYYYPRVGPAVDIACSGWCGGAGPSTPKPVELLTLGGFGTGELVAGRLTVETESDPWWGFWGTPPIHASGTSALLVSQADVAILDASDPAAPEITRTETLLGSVQSVDIRDGRALLSLGERGVQFVDF